IETIKRIHDGLIGQVVSLRAYWVNGNPIWHQGEAPRYGQHLGDTVLEKQLNNWYHYIWLSGDHICEQHVHNIDIGNLIMNDHRDLMHAIVNDNPLNEAKQVADSTLTAIMGREAAYSGAEVDWDTILNSKWSYGPDLLYQDCSKLTWGAFRTLAPPIPSQHDV